MPDIRCDSFNGDTPTSRKPITESIIVTKNLFPEIYANRCVMQLHEIPERGDPDKYPIICYLESSGIMNGKMLLTSNMPNLSEYRLSLPASLQPDLIEFNEAYEGQKIIISYFGCGQTIRENEFTHKLRIGAPPFPENGDMWVEL